ncbi:unnamed protein product, partial [Dicrocoelium dendriticum]
MLTSVVSTAIVSRLAIASDFVMPNSLCLHCSKLVTQGIQCIACKSWACGHKRCSQLTDSLFKIYAEHKGLLCICRYCIDAAALARRPPLQNLERCSSVPTARRARKCSAISLGDHPKNTTNQVEDLCRTCPPDNLNTLPTVPPCCRILSTGKPEQALRISDEPPPTTVADHGTRN